MEQSWRDAVDSAAAALVAYYGNSPALWGYNIGDEGRESWYPEFFDGQQYIAAKVKELAPDVRLKTNTTGFNWQSMLEQNGQYFSVVQDLDEIDVYEYAFETTTPYDGDVFQEAIDRIIMRFDAAMLLTRDRSATWKGGGTLLPASADDQSLRALTPSEYRCQDFLALTRGARGSFLWTFSAGAAGEIVSAGIPRTKQWVPSPAYPGGGYFPYDALRDVNRDLKKLGPYMMILYPVHAFTNNDETLPATWVDTVTGEYIEVGVLEDETDATRFFMLVNRICNNSDASPAAPQAVEVYLNVPPIDADSALVVIDLLTDDTLIAEACGTSYVLRTLLGPGDGRLYKVLGHTGGVPGADNDGDGHEDGCDNCPTVSNPSQADGDIDGIGDACDPCPGDIWNDRDRDGICGNLDGCQLDSLNDADGDGVCADLDNCPTVSNAGQEDADEDGFGDACDNCDGGYLSLADRDLDGYGDGCDNCPDLPNASQEDADGDGVGDACDLCPGTYSHINEDGDGDGFALPCDCDDTDSTLNPLTVWDPDIDGDGYGVPGSFTRHGCEQPYPEAVLRTPTDNCPDVFNPGQEDTDGNGIGDACECACDCHADPECDAQTNVFDVVHAVAVGLRNEPDISDSNPLCPRNATDVDCDNDTDIFDVVRLVGVAFRNESPQDKFCDPCP